VLLSLIWVTTRRRWISIIGAAALFGAYHLTPLDVLYLTFWKFPVTQFMSSLFTGLMWGYLYTRRGLETTILGHTLSNWIPFALFY
jgi:membrane protease YdiL (CAAX protease family)